MHPELTQRIAAQHIAELHEEAARRRLLRESRAGRRRIWRRRRRALLNRLPLRHPRPAAG